MRRPPRSTEGQRAIGYIGRSAGLLEGIRGLLWEAALQGADRQLLLTQGFACLDGGLSGGQRRDASHAVTDGGSANLALVGACALAARCVDHQGDLAIF